MAGWYLGGTAGARRLVSLRTLGQRQFTWADLLSNTLAGVEVCVVYFPSRFDRPVDGSTMDLLTAFGNNTSSRTSVNFWDPKDEQFEQALALFDLAGPPAIVMVNGRVLASAATEGRDETGRYSITFADDALRDEERLIAGVNAANQVLVRGDPQRIASLIRKRDTQGLLTVIGGIAMAVRDQLVALKPKLGLPGGLSIGIG